jgi:hypothetical protein
MKNELRPQNTRGEGFQELRVTQKSNPTKGFSGRAHRRLQGVIDCEQLRRSVKSPERLQQLAANESGRTGDDDTDGRQAISPGRTRGISVSSHGIQEAVVVRGWVLGNIS